MTSRVNTNNLAIAFALILELGERAAGPGEIGEGLRPVVVRELRMRRGDLEAGDVWGRMCQDAPSLQLLYLRKSTLWRLPSKQARKLLLRTRGATTVIWHLESR